MQQPSLGLVFKKFFKHLDINLQYNPLIMDLSSIASGQSVSSPSIAKSSVFPREMSISNDSFESTMTAEHTPNKELSEHNVQESKAPINKQIGKQVDSEIKQLTDSLKKAEEAFTTYKTSITNHLAEISDLFNSSDWSKSLQTLKNKLSNQVLSTELTGPMSRCKSNVKFLNATSNKFDMSSLQGKQEEITNLTEKFSTFQSEFNKTRDDYISALQILTQKYNTEVKALGSQKAQVK